MMTADTESSLWVRLFLCRSALLVLGKNGTILRKYKKEKRKVIKMKRHLYPKDYVESTYRIDFEALREEGYRGVIFDVDNTLVPHGAPADERAIRLFQWLHELGYQVTLLSNNKEPRVKSFSEQVVWASYIYKAGKPKPDKYCRAMEKMGTTEENTLFVGDQIFTDVLGANLAGIRSVLVKPILPWKEEIQIVFKRFAEALILVGYRVYCRRSDGCMPLPLLESEKNKREIGR